MDGTAIRTRGLTKRFGDVLALDRLDLDVQRGEIFGFLGPNGAGKSTTIRLLLGLLRPTAGEAWINGVPVADVERAHRSVGYVPGDVSLWPQLTGSEALHLLGQLSGAVDTHLRDELIERLDLDPSRRIRSYSKGNRQKVALVAAFMTRPDVLLLDEPTVGLDPLMQAEFQSLAREASAAGQTVFLSSHLLDEVEDLCSRVGILRAGVLAEVTTLEQLRAMTTPIFEATVSGEAPALDDLPEVADVEPMPGGIRITVAGPPSGVLRRLLDADLVRLESHPPNLEQIFLTYYDTTEAQRRAVAAAHGGTAGQGAQPGPGSAS
ncbi:MAG: ATP-binding cassette domain-containing protein [Frankiales bacterium]|nr:ATP-binding cassette domain-containing protein [Frankiales bacterium]